MVWMSAALSTAIEPIAHFIRNRPRIREGLLNKRPPAMQTVLNGCLRPRFDVLGRRQPFRLEFQAKRRIRKAKQRYRRPEASNSPARPSGISLGMNPAYPAPVQPIQTSRLMAHIGLSRQHRALSGWAIHPLSGEHRARPGADKRHLWTGLIRLPP